MTCSFEPELTLDEWANILLDPLDGKRYPLSGSIELTERCNLACVHCYINQPPADKKAKDGELDTAQWKNVIDQMADAGCLFLLLTGGEPLLRPDFSEIFIHARQRGMLITLFTNATMLTPQIVDVLSEWGVYAMEVSLYGATSETYERVTRQPGAFEKCLQGIELALSRGLKLDLKTVLLTLNQHELNQMKALTQRFGRKFRYDSSLWPRLDGDKRNMQFEISTEETLALDMQDVERNKSWLDTIEQFKGSLLREERVFTCGAGHRSFHVSANGKLTPCMMVRQPAYDVLSMGFPAAWEELGRIRLMKRQMNTVCETCEVAALCTQCPGWSLAEHGDYETPSRKICELGNLRAINIKIAEI